MAQDDRALDAPPITDEMRAAARRQPGTWLYVLDPAFDPNGRVPPEGIAGAYRVDESGEIVDEFEPNPDYRPTPRGLHLPAPTDPLDDLLQRTATGWASESDLLARLAQSPLWILDAPGAEQVFVEEDADGRRAVWVFSSLEHARRRAPESSWRSSTLAAVVPLLPPDADLTLNPGSPVSVRLPRDDVARQVSASS